MRDSLIKVVSMVASRRSMEAEREASYAGKVVDIACFNSCSSFSRI